MAKYGLEDIYKVNLTALTFFGLWPPKGKFGENKLFAAYSLLVIFGLIFSQLLTQSIVLLYLDGDPYLLASATYNLLQQVVCLTKTYYFLTNFPQIKSLMSRSCEDMFQPKNEEQEKLMDSCISAWKVGYFSFTFNAFAVLSLWFFLPVLDHTTAQYRLPFLAWYPFAYNYSPVYEIVYVYQVISSFYFALATVNIDIFGAGLMTYVAAQCDLLSDNLKNLGSQLKRTKEPSYNFNCCGSSEEEAERKVIIDQMHTKLVHCVNHHRGILAISKEVRRFFRLNSLGQLATSTFSLPMTLFSIFLIKFGTAEFFAMTLYLLAAIQQLLLYCWYGSQVIAKSSKIPYSVFESNWMEGSKEFRKDVLFFSRCSQKVIKFQAVDFFELSLEMFMRVAKGSFSCFALLRQIYAE